VITQNKGRQIRVAPAYLVHRSFKKSEDPAEIERYRLLNTISQLKLKRGFPYPRLESDQEDILGYACLLDEIAVLEREDTGLATVLASLTLEGWHLFGAVMKRLETQANIDEEKRIRQSFGKVVPISSRTRKDG
jgi:hypothetical protein